MQKKKGQSIYLYKTVGNVDIKHFQYMIIWKQFQKDNNSLHSMLMYNLLSSQYIAVQSLL